MKDEKKTSFFIAHRSSLIAHRSSLIAHRSSLIAYPSSLPRQETTPMKNARAGRADLARWFPSPLAWPS
jgi:hypothetical protein